MKARRPNLRPCGVEGCANPHNSHGYCQAHGLRFLRYGDPLGSFQRVPPPEFCSVNGCEKPRARANGLCQMHNWRLAVHGDVSYEPYPVKIGHRRARTLPRECSVPDCSGRPKGHGYCQKHLYRLRNGIPLDAPGKQPAKHRYRAVKRPDHSLAMKNGRVFVHRMVLFDATGGARMPCFWCGRPLEWLRPKLCTDALVVDHRDHDPHNNDPSNLLPSCNSCNAGRIKGFNAVRVPVYRSPDEHGNDTHVLVGT